MSPTRWLVLLAVLCFAGWLALVVLRPIPSGWVHLALVAGVLLTVRAIVAADAARGNDA